MTDLVQQFETPVTGRDGAVYVPYVRGHMRADRRWEAFIEFRRAGDGATFITGAETTQPDWQGVLYWATGLGEAYFEGALDRAMNPHPFRPAAPPLQPVVDRGVDSVAREERVAQIAQQILAYFRRRSVPRLMTDELFGWLPFANADVVRTLEYLEQRERYVVRRTDQGNDWLYLTDEGLHAVGLDVPHKHDEAIIDRRKPRR